MQVPGELPPASVDTAQWRGPDVEIAAAAEPADTPRWSTSSYLAVATLGVLLSTQVEGFDELDEAFGEQRGGHHRLSRTAPRALGDFPTVLGVASGVLLVGQASGDPGMSRAGIRSLEALAISSVLTAGLKFVVGRGRPGHYAEADSFHPFTTHSSSWSFPSGHTSAAFALATALTLELGDRGAWVPVVSYSLAGWVGVSRVLDNRHWPTDVLAGAAVGILSGRLARRWFGGNAGDVPSVSPIGVREPGGRMLYGLSVAMR